MAFDEDGTAFLEILRDDFGCAAKGVHINKGNFFLGFAGFVFPGAIDGETEFGNRGAFWRVAHFGIAGEIAGKNDFVEVGHNGSLCYFVAAAFGAGALVKRTRKTSSFIAKRFFNWSSAEGWLSKMTFT